MALLVNTFAAGFFYLLAGLFGLTRHFLLEPRIPTLPKTPRWLLRVFFGFSVVMIYVGLRYLASWFMGAPLLTQPSASNLAVLVAFTVLSYKAALLYDTVTRKGSYSLDELIQRLKDLG